MEQSKSMGRLSFFPAAAGFWLGILFLLLLDSMIPHLHQHADQAEGPRSHLERTTLMLLAVTLHNIPEGMAVGVVYAGLRSESPLVTAGGALALSLGIAIQNFPEGAIISMPLHGEGKSKGSAFLDGVLSGAVEPVFGIITIITAAFAIPAMPYIQSQLSPRSLPPVSPRKYTTPYTRHRSDNPAALPVPAAAELSPRW